MADKRKLEVKDAGSITGAKSIGTKTGAGRTEGSGKTVYGPKGK